MRPQEPPPNPNQKRRAKKLISQLGVKQKTSWRKDKMQPMQRSDASQFSQASKQAQNLGLTFTPTSEAKAQDFSTASKKEFGRGGGQARRQKLYQSVQSRTTDASRKRALQRYFTASGSQGR